MEADRTYSALSELVSRVGSFLLACAVGAAAAGAAVAMGEPTKKKLVFLAAAPLLPLLIAITRRPRTVLLFFWVLTLPYNRMYFSFEGITGDQGSQGPYWIPSDIFLLALLGHFAYEQLVLRRPSPAAGPLRVLPWAAPFLAAGVLSMMAADRPAWSFFELMRLTKVGLVIYLLRCWLRREEWWACAAALGLSICIQSALGCMQVALRSVSGVLGMFGGGGADAQAVELGLAAMGGWIRAVGTIGHPSNLASYYLLTLPLFIALTFSVRHVALRLLCACVAAIGAVGLACTLSRWPCAVMVVLAGLVLIGLIYYRHVALKTVLGITCVLSFLGALALIPAADFIYERLTRDLGESLDFRAKDRRVGLQIFSTSPWTGVGLNNYAHHVVKYDPEMEWALENEHIAREVMNVRTFAALHNFYLFMLAETGVIGLTGLIIFIAGLLRIGLRAVIATTHEWQGACIGLLAGIVGLLLQGFIDFSAWVDPLLYTTALVIAMLATAPAIQPRPGAQEVSP
jgi:O-antigen ligase